MDRPIVDPDQPVDYASSITPTNYACERCNKTGIKLWRRYLAFLSNQTLLCAEDAALEQGVDISTMQPNGTYTCDLGILAVSIGGMSPAVPTPENDNYWSNGSIPFEGWEWWRRLPLE